MVITAEKDTKICAACKIDKPKSEYHKLNTKSCGVQARCKECTSKYKKERYWRNHEAELAKMTKSRLRPENTQQRKEYYEKNKDEYRERAIRYRLDEFKKENQRNIGKKYFQQNADKTRERHRKNSQREAVKARVRERHNKRKNIDPEYIIKRRLRFRVRNVFRLMGKKSYKAYPTMDLLGCEMAFFKQYIEDKFTDGMSWERISEIHIDHIKPCASFNLIDPEEQKRCFHYTNLQPLWDEENTSKGAKYKDKNYRYVKNDGTIRGFISKI